jgi:1-aminocyclopropane-1-carboxylate deaminase/D-cysteine desulfhydrase-like pyridoxal-dependent ACC family enzyme
MTQKEKELGIKARLDQIPRVHLATCNTPLQRMPRLSARLQGPDILVKRDDLTDLALGGNKARIMEYMMADAAAHGADTVIATAFTQSNLCRQTAAAARKMGMQAILVLKGIAEEVPKGNLLLDVMLGADLHIIDTTDDNLVHAYINNLMEKSRRSGHTSYFFDSHGDAARFATFAYLRCLIEILEQSEEIGVEPSAMILASASGGTQSGLDLGVHLLRENIRILAVNPMSWSSDWIKERALNALTLASSELGYSSIMGLADITVLGEYVGEGYGIPTQLSKQAQMLFAQDEAIILDPSYTAKAAGAMIDLINSGRWSKDEAIIFVHTGGVPTVFASDMPYDLSKLHILTQAEALEEVGR